SWPRNGRDLISRIARFRATPGVRNCSTSASSRQWMIAVWRRSRSASGRTARTNRMGPTMTSEAGRKRTSKDRGEPDGAGRSARLIRPTAPVRAFTILELLLALAVLVLLLTLAVVGLDQLRSRAWLDEGVSRFETVLRMARTEAAGRGQRLQLAFDDASGAVDLLIEADPLGAPGQFQPFTGCTWLHQLPNDLVRVRRSVI